MPFSHHSHSGQFCRHATGSLEQVVQEAVRKGFRTYALTEHVPRYRSQDLYPEEKDCTLSELADTFDNYVAEAWRLKRAYAHRIELLVGLETEFINEESLVQLEALLNRYPIELQFLVGSVHHVLETPIDFDRATFDLGVEHCRKVQGRDDGVVALMSTYFDHQWDLISRFRPQVIGHFDLCRLYLPTFDFLNYPDLWQQIERNVRFIINYGGLFEVNAAAFRKGWQAAYPGSEILQLIVKLGGKLTLSDDSHGPQAVGLNYLDAFAYLRRLGVSELWYLAEPDSTGTERRLVVKQVEGNWWEDSFWTNLKTPTA